MDCIGKDEVRLPLYAINDKTALGVVHHVAQSVLREPAVGLLLAMLLFAVGDATPKTTLEEIVVEGCKPQCRVRNPGFHSPLPSVIRSHELVWPLVPIGGNDCISWLGHAGTSPKMGNRGHELTS